MASKISNFLARTQEFFFGKSFFLRTHEGFAKNCFLSCHLAILVSLIPFLKGVGCRMASENSNFLARTQEIFFLQTLARRRAGKTKRRTFLPARPRMRDFEISSYTLHPTPLKKGMRDTKMARWQLKMPFFTNPSCVGGRAGKPNAERSCLPARVCEILIFHLPSYTLHP